MPKSKHKMKPLAPVLSTRPAAAEDLRVGDYVAIAESQLQTMPFGCDDSFNPPTRVSKLAYIPHDAGEPRRVVAVGPPFLLVQKPDSSHETLDLRLTQLLHLDHAYGQEAYKRLAPKKRKKRKR